ncbi:membrane protein insertion efficiency factor YidD [Desulfosudis oleivorans]|uniref:Membrane protein insertion efficiency factor YidD n=1 Tax=Desulfosudis oleivorans (strain DSM 6200 / JCM 39069 / Hxd3) TaxID=96561 RepID=A8ZWZ7_DESOH|nr:membrane protein insertion efficiency factor YidD [Desulfosudis oleivorans]ABW66853.1 protein of unknown function DUF37 [Desulfosudis oleivorans Hxd3]
MMERTGFCKTTTKQAAWLFFFSFFICCATAGPVVSEDRHDSGTIENPAAAGATPSGAVRLFQRYISPIDGDRCPMHPSCSAYSLSALEKHGLLMGWIMTCDRLLRCGRDELTLAPRVVVNGRVRCYDSVERNDFWWTK